MTNFNIAVTGHRPDKLGGYDLNNEINLKIRDQLKKHVLKVIGEYAPPDAENIYLISGMALGVDTIFAQIAIELRETDSRIKLYCAIPFTHQYIRWIKSSVTHYKELLSLADYVRDLHPHTEPLSSAQVYKLMHERNEFMVNNADILIAVWNGTSGGTGNCVNYAKSINSTRLKKILILDPSPVKT